MGLGWRAPRSYRPGKHVCALYVRCASGSGKTHARIRVQSYDRTMDAHQNRFKAIAELVGDVMAETLWPTRCAVCDMPGQLLCEACARRLTAIDACLACPTCGAPFGRIQCTECNTLMLRTLGHDRIPFDTMSFALVADHGAQRIVKAYKDQGERRLVTQIAQRCVPLIGPDRCREGCAITFVPDSLDAQRRRGFDHGRELACRIADEAGLDCLGLLMPPQSVDQRELGRRQRSENMAHALHVAPGAPVPTHLIVFDDICTTGSTLFAAADALAAAGALHLHALAFGRV